MEQLLVLVGVLDLALTVSSDWTAKPQDLIGCVGQTVSFDWKYDDTEYNATRITITKNGPPPTIMLDKVDKQEPRLTSSRMEFRPNAGLALEQLNPGDAGNYTCSVSFSDERLNLVDTTTLKVYSGCPQPQKYFTPLIFYTVDSETRILGGSSLNISSNSPRQVEVKLEITLPAAVPAVHGTVYKVKDSYPDHKCRGVNTKDHNCTAYLFFNGQGLYAVHISLEYPAYAKSETSIQLNLAATGGPNSTLIAAIVVPVLILILIVVIVFCQRKYGTMGFWNKCCDMCLGEEDTSRQR